MSTFQVTPKDSLPMPELTNIIFLLKQSMDYLAAQKENIPEKLSSINNMRSVLKYYEPAFIKFFKNNVDKFLEVTIDKDNTNSIVVCTVLELIKELFEVDNETFPNDIVESVYLSLVRIIDRSNSNIQKMVVDAIKNLAANIYCTEKVSAILSFMIYEKVDNNVKKEIFDLFAQFLNGCQTHFVDYFDWTAIFKDLKCGEESPEIEKQKYNIIKSVLDHIKNNGGEDELKAVFNSVENAYKDKIKDLFS